MTDERDEAMRQARRSLAEKYAKSAALSSWKVPAPVWALLCVAFGFALYLYSKPPVPCETQHPDSPLACSHLKINLAEHFSDLPKVTW